jgi:hypothetical protein
MTSWLMMTTPATAENHRVETHSVANPTGCAKSIAANGLQKQRVGSFYLALRCLYDLLHRCQRCKSRNPLQIPTQLIHCFYLAFIPQTFFFLLLAANPSLPLRSDLPLIVRADEQLSPLLSCLPERITAPTCAHRQQHERLKRKAVAVTDVQVQCASTVIAL